MHRQAPTRALRLLLLRGRRKRAPPSPPKQEVRSKRVRRRVGRNECDRALVGGDRIVDPLDRVARKPQGKDVVEILRIFAGALGQYSHDLPQGGPIPGLRHETDQPQKRIEIRKPQSGGAPQAAARRGEISARDRRLGPDQEGEDIGGILGNQPLANAFHGGPGARVINVPELWHHRAARMAYLVRLAAHRTPSAAVSNIKALKGPARESPGASVLFGLARS